MEREPLLVASGGGRLDPVLTPRAPGTRRFRGRFV